MPNPAAMGSPNTTRPVEREQNNTGAKTKSSLHWAHGDKLHVAENKLQVETSRIAFSEQNLGLQFSTMTRRRKKSRGKPDYHEIIIFKKSVTLSIALFKQQMATKPTFTFSACISHHLGCRFAHDMNHIQRAVDSVGNGDGPLGGLCLHLLWSTQLMALRPCDAH